MSTTSRKHTVCLGWISPGEVRHEFAESLVHTFRRHQSMNRQLIRATVSVQSGPRIAEARSQVTDHFLATRCEWLWMVDADMSFEPDALERLLATAKAERASIVGGLCFGGRGDNTIFPTLYRMVTAPDGALGTDIIWDWPADARVKVDATGAAFLLVHRDVFRDMKRHFGRLADGAENPYPWWVEGTQGGRPYGEDIAFCLKARALDYDVVVDTSVQVGHLKTHELNLAKYTSQQNRTTTVD